jgi:hypothetical protein
MQLLHQIRIPILRLLWLALSSLAAVWLGFFFLDSAEAVQFVGLWGYWFVALPFLLLCLEALSGLRGALSELRSKDAAPSICWRGALRRKLFPALFVIFVSGVLWASQPMAFKVVMDEPVIAATSMQMHEEKQAFAATQMYEVEGTRYGIGKLVDKRPLFFPFLLSVLHDLTGYRPTQGFYLNGLLLVGVLGLVFCLGRRLCPPHGGYLAAGLLATAPLLAINATSSGFDLLNLWMILILGLSLEAYLRKPEDGRLNRLLLLAVLLAQTRYESVLFVIPVALAIVYVWIREKEIRITKTLLLVPPMLIVYALQRGIMNGYEGFWQLPQGVERPFGLHFLGENLRIATDFFFSRGHEQPNSLLLTGGSLLASIAFLRIVWTRRDRLTGAYRVIVPWLGLAAVVGANFMLLMAYHWGRLDDPVAARLALPVIFVQLFFVIYVLGRTHAHPRWQLAIGAIVLAYFMLFTRPVYARTDFFEWSVRNAQCDYLLQLCAGMETGENNLIISELGVVPGIAQTSSVLTGIALENLGKLDFHWRLQTFDRIYVVYLLRTGEPHDASAYLPGIDRVKERLQASFEMETLDEVKMNNAIYMRLARVTGIRLMPGEVYTFDMEGVGMTDEGALMHPGESLSEAFAESLPK